MGSERRPDHGRGTGTRTRGPGGSRHGTANEQASSPTEQRSPSGAGAVVPHRGRARQPAHGAGQPAPRRPGLDGREQRPAAHPRRHVLPRAAPRRRGDGLRRPADVHGLARRSGPAAGRPRLRGRRGVRGGGPPGCGGPGPGLALAPGPVPVQREREPAPGPGDRGGRRSVPPRHAGADDGLAPPEARRVAAPRATRAGRRLHRRHRPVPQPPGRRAAPRGSAASTDGRRLQPASAVARHPACGAGPGRRRRRGGVPGTVGGPGPAEQEPHRPDRGAAVPRGPGRPAAPAPARRPAAPRLPGGAAAADLPRPRHRRANAASPAGTRRSWRGLARWFTWRISTSGRRTSRGCSPTPWCANRNSA